MQKIATTLLCAAPFIIVGCDSEPGPAAPADNAAEETERGKNGKADAPGSCQPDDCGGRASIGQCWCDELCSQYNDCCADKVSVCDGGGEPDPEPEPVDPGGDDPSWTFADVWGVPNLDDDDGVYLDWNQQFFDGDDDVSVIELGDAVSGMGPGDRIQLELFGDTAAIRVLHEGTTVAGNGAGTNSFVFTPSAGDTLQVEFGDYLADGTLRIGHVVGNTVVAEDDVALRSAPLVMNHHLQPSEHVWAVSVNAPDYDNAQMIATYQQVLGSDFTAVPGPSYEWDVWMQDEFEFATLVGDDQRMDVVIDSIRDRGLDGYAQDALVGPDFIAQTWGSPFQATTYDSFGNLEASPPVTVGGLEYPLGRIYYGRRGSAGPTSALRSFLASQQVQAPFEVPTDWLCVGHVDEFSSFVPDPSSPKGFKMLIADIDSGLALLETLPASTSLPRYGADHGYPTVGSMRDSAGLRAVNVDIRDDYMLPIRELMMAELGLSDADVIEVPSLFDYEGGCGAVSLVPGMVNLIVADGTDGDTHLFVPDPFFRTNPAAQGSDPFIEAFAESMPAGLDLHFVDDWDVYHLGIGEVHCGTNVTRTPTDAWWNATDLVD